MRAIRIVLAVVLCAAAAVRWEPSAQAQAGSLSLGLTVNTSTITPGDTLVAGVTVNNPGNGPLADFYFVIVLPDGATVVSAGPGMGASVGTIGNLRSFVPVVRGISLASPFPYSSGSFFSYTFSGIEPLGTYRIYFAAVRTGALNDGVLDPSDLLAVATQDVTVTNSPVVVDTARTVTRAIAPGGGVVQTTSASGALLTLALPAGAVKVTTPISIAPLIAFRGRPGPVVAGLSAGPSGLRLSPPATLTVTLPPGFQESGFGLRGVIADDRGQNLEFVPVTRAGNVLTMTVSHFSVAEIEVLLDFDDFACDPADAAFPFPPEQVAACAAIDPLADAEAVRLARDGGPISQAFKNALVPIFNTWLTNGLLPRLLDAQTPIPGQPFEKYFKRDSEWRHFYSMYGTLFGLSDRTNQAGGRPLGASIDLAQERFRVAIIATMNAANIQCLADKAQVDIIVLSVSFLLGDYNAQFPEPPAMPPFELVFCVDVRIDAAPPPVLTPGQAALFPVDVRMRFTDGVELPGRQAAVTVSGTNGTVTPAGGVLTLPVATNLSLLPTATESTVTITAAPISRPGEALGELPTRTRTFHAGQSATIDLVVTSASIEATVAADLPTRPGLRNDDSRSVFAPTQSVSAAMNEQVTSSGRVFRSSSLSTATRTVASAAGATTVSGSLRAEPQLSAQPPQPGSSGNSGASSSQEVCFNLPRPHQAAYQVQGNQQNPSDRFTVQLRLQGGNTQRDAFAGDSGSFLLPAGPGACISFTASGWGCTLEASSPNGAVCQTPNPLIGSYTVTLTPAP